MYTSNISYELLKMSAINIHAIIKIKFSFKFSDELIQMKNTLDAIQIIAATTKSEHYNEERKNLKA